MTASDAAAIEIAGLSKRFGKRPAVIDLDLRVDRGEMVGLLGHNGAGKSTTLGCLLGQCFPDRGTIRVLSHDVFAARSRALARLGAIFETPCFYQYLSGRANLEALTRLSGPLDRARLDAVVERVGLTERIDDAVSKYSHGMRQRLALAQALLPGPEIVVLDEPSDGLDPAGIVEMRELIRELHRDLGLTVLFASHQLVEVERLCDRVVVLDRGRKVYDGSWRAAPGFERLVEVALDRPAEALRFATQRGLVESDAAVTREAAEAGTARWKLAEAVEASAVNRALVEAGFEVQAIAAVRPRLEDLYLALREGRGVEAAA